MHQAIIMKYSVLILQPQEIRFWRSTWSARFFQSAGSSSRTIFGGGYDYSASSRLNVMQYITLSPGNATDFGDLTQSRNPKGATVMAQDYFFAVGLWTVVFFQKL